VNSTFISLSTGTVELSAVLRANLVHRALKTALWFRSSFGRNDAAYVFSCWAVPTPRQAVEIEGIAEEVGDFNTYRRYSDFRLRVRSWQKSPFTTKSKDSNDGSYMIIMAGRR
jgi:hypothetical protein